MFQPPPHTVAAWFVVLAAVALSGCPPRPLFDSYRLPGISSTDNSGLGDVSVLLRPEGNTLGVGHYGRFDSVAVVRRDAGEIQPLGTFDLTVDSGTVKAGISGSLVRDTLGHRLTSRYEVYALLGTGERRRLPVEYATTDRAYAERLGAL